VPFPSGRAAATHRGCVSGGGLGGQLGLVKGWLGVVKGQFGLVGVF